MGEITPQCNGNTASSQFPFALLPTVTPFSSWLLAVCSCWLVVCRSRQHRQSSSREGRQAAYTSNSQQQHKNHKEKRINMSIGSCCCCGFLSSLHRAEFSIFLVHIRSHMCLVWPGLAIKDHLKRGAPRPVVGCLRE